LHHRRRHLSVKRDSRDEGLASKESVGVVKTCTVACELEPAPEPIAIAGEVVIPLTVFGHAIEQLCNKRSYLSFSLACKQRDPQIFG